MCLASPPGFLNITIFITGKRKANEPPVLEGFVTDDQRDAPPSSKDEGSAKGEKSDTKSEGRAIDGHGHTLQHRSKQQPSKKSSATATVAVQNEKTTSPPPPPPPRVPSPDRELDERRPEELHPRGEKHILAPSDQNASSPVSSAPTAVPAPINKHSTSTSSSSSGGWGSRAVKQVTHGATVVLRSGRPDFHEIVKTEVEATAYEE